MAKSFSPLLRVSENLIAIQESSFEKHKIFLYKEDFEKFLNGLQGVIEFIETGKKPEIALDNQDEPESEEL